MNNLQMKSFGVQELDAEELVNVDGGLNFISMVMVYTPVIRAAASEFASGFADGFKAAFDEI